MHTLVDRLNLTLNALLISLQSLTTMGRIIAIVAKNSSLVTPGLKGTLAGCNFCRARRVSSLEAFIVITKYFKKFLYVILNRRKNGQYNHKLVFSRIKSMCFYNLAPSLKLRPKCKVLSHTGISMMTLTG